VLQSVALIVYKSQNREEKCGPKNKLAHIKITIEKKRGKEKPFELLRFNHHSPIVSNLNNLFKPEVSQNLEKLVRKDSEKIKV
jgi:hypothetical protein